MGGPHKLNRVTNRLEDFDEIDRLMLSTEAAVFLVIAVAFPS